MPAIIFDLDNTLHDKSATLLHFATSQYESMGLANLYVDRNAWVDDYLKLNNQRIPKKDVFGKLAAAFGLNESLRERLLQDFDANLGLTACPFPQALELVRDCREQGLKIGIVTNGRDEFQRAKIEGMGLTSLVDNITTSGGMGVKKPDHRIFAACLEAMKSDASSATMVGDDLEADMKPAKEMGMRTVWKSGTVSEHLDFCSDHLPEIQAYLRSTVGHG